MGVAARPKPARTDHAVPAPTVERVIWVAMSPPPAGSQPVDDALAREARGPDERLRVGFAAPPRDRRHHPSAQHAAHRQRFPRAFMRQVVRAYPKRELHAILDNSSTHGTPAVREWLGARMLDRISTAVH